MEKSSGHETADIRIAKTIKEYGQLDEKDKKIPYVTTESESLKAFVDGYILGEHGGTVNCLSIFGAIGAVQAIAATLVSGKSIELWGKGEFGKELHKQWGKVKYRMISKRLPASKMLTMIVVVDSAMLSDDPGDFMIITKTENPVDLLYGNLIVRSEIPLHVSWKKWLWSTFVHFEWLKELPGYNMRGFEISFNDDELAEKIEIGIRSGRIPKI